MPHQPNLVVGSILGDVYDWGKKLFSSIPGSEWVEDAINTGASWLKDVAQDETGRLILVGITNAMLFPAVAGIAIPSASGMQTIGPQVASVVWAVPNLAAGDGFVESYAAEVTWRFQYLASIFGLGGAAKTFLDETRKVLEIPKVQSVSQQVWNSYLSTGPAPPAKPGEIAPPTATALDTSKIHNDSLKAALKKAGSDPVGLSKQYGIREDAAAAALNGLMGRNLWDLNNDFDDNGKLIKADAPSTKAESISRKTRELFSQAAKPFGGKPLLVFASNPSASPRGPVGQLFIFAFLTSPAWGPFVLRHLLRR